MKPSTLPMLRSAHEGRNYPIKFDKVHFIVKVEIHYTGNFAMKGVRVPAIVIGVHYTRVLLQGILLLVTFAGLTNVQYCSLLDWGPERFLMKSISSPH